MNRLQLQTTLSSATASTFEELALLCGDLVGGREEVAEPLAGGVCVDFAGPVHGALVLRVTAGALDAAAANMLALDAPPDETLRRDALGEVANVICGTLLPALAGARAEFVLEAPRWIGATGEARGTCVAEACVPLEDGRATVALHLLDTAAGGTDAR
ncbi:MAG TPA: chemotaxis protein CheX [Gemmatimonadaceae bacterium]|nr:chemotaxis protein CheX [Gemmatimonadaceae bacterium]